MKIIVPRRDIIKPSRRLFIAGLGAALAAPAILRAQSLPILGTASKGSSSLGLQTSLGAFYELENTSWLDATANANNLTPINTPTSASTAPTVVGNYGGFVSASAQKLEVASSASILTTGGDFSVAGWAYFTTFTGGHVFSKFGAFGNREFYLTTVFTSGNVGQLGVYTNTGATLNFVNAATFGALSANTWYFLCGTWTASTKIATISVNAGARDSSTAASASNTGALTAKLNIGGDDNANVNGNHNGRVDQIGLWKGRVLSPADEVLLYNGGAGLSYAAMA